MAEQKMLGASSEVSWPLDETTVYATLLRPAGAGPFPGVVMVAGSGPTDRDWNTPLLPGTNGSARLLAEALAEDGIASLRYDKRPSGPHAAENVPPLIGKIGLQSHLDELAGAVSLLAGQEWIDAHRILALTSSEGGLHALNYQVHNPAIPFAGLVLTGAPGRIMGDMARAQVVRQLAVLPNGDELIAAYDTAIANFMAGQPVAVDPAWPQGMQMLLAALTTPANQPFSHELWVADAAAWLAEVQVPVLVIIGKKDIQADWQADGGVLQAAVAGHDNVAFLFPDNANHVLKYEPTPRAELDPNQATAGYNTEDKYLDPETLAGLRGWLAAHI